MEQAVRRERPYLVLHLGDLVRDFQELQSRMPMQTMQNVCGNCDGFTEVPDQRVLLVEGRRILMTHWHRYHVKQTYGPAYYAAREAEADVLLFGHTHIPYCEREGELWILNPGSCRGSGGTYGVIDLGAEEIRCEIRRMGDGAPKNEGCV